ncbi:CDP-alcohol phosphatidyltransferase family protein [Pseudoruegeria sp. HB172150]|uniref:CDP-alcohol phosphatidyltransferase family protein n=1 Tax=Pseudoruegeria sp. HB172150 TaxID=2721164 RepID=UPI0020A6D85F|nr:CDP-alcohol phosphatidyltransferase family protein [Pseudoruegeria sp. HB172150]
MASIVFAALAGGAFWWSGYVEGWPRVIILIAAALGCQLRLLCNLFDGMAAVEGGKGEPDGPFWNEAPDRAADILIFVGMGLGAGFPALGWAAACLPVLTAYLRELGSSNGLPADFTGPLAKPQRMAVATGIVVLSIAWPATLIWGLWAMIAGTALTALFRSMRLVKSLRQPR